MKEKWQIFITNTKFKTKRVPMTSSSSVVGVFTVSPYQVGFKLVNVN